MSDTEPPGNVNTSPRATQRVPARVYLQGSRSHLMTVVAGGYPQVERHDAIVVLARAGARFTLNSGADTFEHDAVAISPMAQHGIESTGGFALVAVHLWHPLFKAVKALARQPVTPLRRADFSALDGRLDAAIDQGVDVDGAADLVDVVLERALESAPVVAPLDARVLEAMRILDSEIDTPFETIARRVSVSTSRLSHLFTSELGISYRGFLVWWRLRMAWEMIAFEPRVSLTEIASKAGYADAAHLSRAFRESFGLTPTGMRDTRREIIGRPMPAGQRAVARSAADWIAPLATSKT